MINDNAHRTADFIVVHTPGLNENRTAVRAKQVDLSLTIIKHVNMCGLMIVDEDHHTQPAFTQYSVHRLR